MWKVSENRGIAKHGYTTCSSGQFLIDFYCLPHIAYATRAFYLSIHSNNHLSKMGDLFLGRME